MRKTTKAENIYNRKREALLVTRSIVIAVGTSYLWAFVTKWLYPFFGLPIDGHHGVELGSALIIFMPSVTFTLLQGFILNRVMTQHSRIKGAIDTWNARVFLEERDRRVPIITHVILFCIMMMILFITALYGYPSREIGVMVIGFYTFIASLLFFLAIELDNAFEGLSRVPPEKIPKGWMDMKIQDIIEGNVVDCDNYKKYCSKNGIEETKEEILNNH